MSDADFSYEDDRRADYIPVEYEYHLTDGYQAERLDVYLTYRIRNATRTKVQRAISEGYVSVNGSTKIKASYKIRPGDHIVCRLMKPPPIELIPEDIPLQILYEDDDVLVIDKEAGMVVHPGFGNRNGTLVNAVLYHMGVRETRVLEREDDDDASMIYSDAAIRPGIVHRLDRETSGVMVISKKEHIHARLAEQFARRTTRREYIALAWGVFSEDEGTIEGNIGRSTRDRKIMAVLKRDGKPARTDYTVLERFEFATLIRCKLHTGRTHQIRVHCAHIGHPLFGDPTYGGREVHAGPRTRRHRQTVKNLLELMPRQALHARTLGFMHPGKNAQMDFESPLPADMNALLERLRNLPGADSADAHGQAAGSVREW